MIIAFLGQALPADDLSSMKNTVTLGQEVSKLIKNAEFTAAKEFVNKARADGKWCDYFNAKGSCYTPASPDAPKKLLEKIDSEEICFNSIEEGSKPIKYSNRALELSDLINEKCSGFVFNKYPDEEFDKIVEKIGREKYALPESSKNKDGSTDLLTESINKCNEQSRYYYETEAKKPEVIVDQSGSRAIIQRHGTKRKGSFATNEECELARKKDLKASDNNCQITYEGSEISIKLPTIYFINHVMNVFGVSKIPIYFSKMEDCVSKTKNGIKLEDFDVAEEKSDQPTRLASNCELKKLVICKKGTSSPRRPDYYFK